MTQNNLRKSVKKTTVKKSERRIYIGPNTAPLKQFTVVESEYPMHIKDLVNDCPAVDKLFVPIADLATAAVRTNKLGTLENRHYKDVQKFIKEGQVE